MIHQELANKTALTIVSKPVPRPVFIAGKYIGVSGAILVAGYVLMLVFMLTLRHRVLQNKSDPIDWPVVLFGVGAVLGALGQAAAANYLYKKVFTSTFIYALLLMLTGAFCLVLLIDKGLALPEPGDGLHGRPRAHRPGRHRRGVPHPGVTHPDRVCGGAVHAV